MEAAPEVRKAIIGKQDVRTPEQRRIDVIEKVYYNNVTGYRNIKETWKAAKAIDASITEKDVKEWKQRLEAQKKQVPGYNSFIASKPYEEFQIDLLFFTPEGKPEPRAEVKKIDDEDKLAEDERLAEEAKEKEEERLREEARLKEEADKKAKKEAAKKAKKKKSAKELKEEKEKEEKEKKEQEEKEKKEKEEKEKAKKEKKKKPKVTYIPGLIAVDTFSKYCTIVILTGGKTTVSVATGLFEALTTMGCYEEGNHLPETIYSDNEPALTSKDMQQWFTDNKIRHLTTQGHAPVAERTIRTIKAINDARRKAPANKDRDWQVVLQESVKSYNDVHSHRATEMTPDKARKPENEDTVKKNLEEKRVTTRIYPELNVGDSVRLYHKKNQLDKERIALWSDTIYKVEEITVSKGQQFYKINNGKEHPYMRHELLKIV